MRTSLQETGALNQQHSHAFRKNYATSSHRLHTKQQPPTAAFVINLSHVPRGEKPNSLDVSRFKSKPNANLFSLNLPLYRPL